MSSQFFFVYVCQKLHNQKFGYNFCFVWGEKFKGETYTVFGVCVCVRE